MALHSLRLRRSLSALSVLHRHVSATPAISARTSHSIFCPSTPSPSNSPAMILLRSSSMAFSSRSSFGSHNEDDKIGPDTILFEGCDYNHWLITMEFPKDPKPTPEEMVRTYEETCAKGLNISVEEAKKKMYSCSTTTYQGFQAVMTEEESEKFRGLPGVVFILPDSYIDPVNKEYGGDKYIDGTIIPRPPPVQYGRQGGRYRDRNSRNPDQPRYDRNPDQPRYDRNPDQPRYDRNPDQPRYDRNPDQPRYDRNPDQQRYERNPDQQRYERNPDQQRYERNPGLPNLQGNPSYSQHGSMQGDVRNFGAPQSYSPQGQPQNDGPPGPRERRDPSPMNIYAPEGREPYQPQREQRDYVPLPSQGNSGSGFNPAQGGGGYNGHGTGTPYGQGQSQGSYPGSTEAQRFPQGDQRNMQGEQQNYTGGQTWNNQGRF